MIDKEKAIDIVRKFDFFYSHRAGRMLWCSKTLGAQEEDLHNFHRDCEDLLDFLKSLEVANEQNIQ